MCGGKPEVFERARPLLEKLAASMRFIGPAGKAAQVKALVNIVMNINTAALAEGLALGDALGLDLAMFPKFFSRRRQLRGAGRPDWREEPATWRGQDREHRPGPGFGQSGGVDVHDDVDQRLDLGGLPAGPIKRMEAASFSSSGRARSKNLRLAAAHEIERPLPGLSDARGHAGFERLRAGFLRFASTQTCISGVMVAQLMKSLPRARLSRPPL